MRTKQSRFSHKREDIEERCIYGFDHFCDGTPNISVNPHGTHKRACPMSKCCEIKKHSIFEEINNNEN